MKFNYLVKATPFLSTIILITFLSLSNQKENTKLRILIWDTPSLSLGTYLAISTGTGFILSYFITTSLANGNKPTTEKLLEYKLKSKHVDKNENKDTINF